MSFFRSKETDQLILALQREIVRLSTQYSDLLEHTRSIETSFAKERQELLDRLLAISNPAALRELNRPATPRPAATRVSSPPPSRFPARPTTAPPRKEVTTPEQGNDIPKKDLN